jgi:hypothetical protein
MSKWIDLTNDITPEGKDNLEVNQVLIFNDNGVPVHIKIMRKTKTKIYGKMMYLYHPDEVLVKGDE